ncbi:BLUF domain-containing protein [Wenzhouxiangella marina]|uniref:BLUF domain-containing protein n=1 Tax=Wenzhouxiangella marina TaxID=1579979 RepID=A0A0K0XUY6_9GAMM|nr:BLUF domain-containing protein [Wenzhouxiangella marina]AKS41437.1 BLUF domain-containing protein [Wenzhouxiangella marina]MBB6086809.1 hypothetical protein [Wenzhouxiangella marina]
MSDLIQLVYASRSNLNSSGDRSGVEPGVARILTQSRRNNGPRQIGGVLCYGDDHFFQCLEGERETVEALYERLHEDDRHRDVTLLVKRPVEQRRFKLWAMKYLSVDREVRQVLDKAGLKTFDPFKFDADLTERMLEVLRQATESEHASKGRGSRPAPEPAGSVADREDTLPLAYLGMGAVMAALAVIVVLAIGIR